MRKIVPHADRELAAAFALEAPEKAPGTPKTPAPAGLPSSCRQLILLQDTGI